MRKNVEWYQLLLAVISVIIATFSIVSMYANKIENSAKETATKTENHEQRINILEANRVEMKQDMKDIKASQVEILLILKDKQDRK